MRRWWLLGGTLGLTSLCLALAGFMVLLVVLLAPFGLASSQASPSSASSTSTSGQERQVAFPDYHRVWQGQRNQEVVTEAFSIASALYTGPPHGYTTWYHADTIPQALAYWQRTCTGGCAENWAQGNLQCTMLVTASYGVVGQDVPFAGDAATWWTWHRYQNQPGWQEIEPTDLPWPGDVIVWDSGSAFGGAGHVAIVVDVLPPTAQSAGYVQFVQANAGSAFAQAPLILVAEGTRMQTWPGYTVLGYLRHTVALS